MKRACGGCHARLALINAVAIFALAGRGVADDAPIPSKYIIATIPDQMLIVYITFPELTVRTLIDGRLPGQAIVPSSIAFHAPTGRLFVTELPMMKIWYFQLVQLPDGRIITDGRKTVAIESISAHALCVDDVGNIFWTGKAMSPLPWAQFGKEAIFQHIWPFLVQGETHEGSLDGVWNDGNSGDMQKVFAPGALFCEGSSLYMANSQGGRDHGSLLKLPTTVPDMRPGGAVKIIADNTDTVTGITMGPRFVFWGTPNGVYGAPKSKVTSGCGYCEPPDATGKPTQCRECRLITDELAEPVSLMWDGDGTIYLADRASNAIYSIPSGNLERHRPTKLVTLGGQVHSMVLMQLASSAARALGGGRLALALAALVALAPLITVH